MPWLMVNHTRLEWRSAVPSPDFALDVQRGGMPGHPGANFSTSSAIVNCFFQQIAATGDTRVRRMLAQFFETVDSGRDGDHGRVHSPRSRDIRRSIADQINRGVHTKPSPRFFDAVTKDIFAQFVAIAEGAEGKILSQPGRGNLGPTNGLEIPGNYAEEFSGLMQAAQ